jgi:hypothetical protein
LQQLQSVTSILRSAGGLGKGDLPAFDGDGERAELDVILFGNKLQP